MSLEDRDPLSTRKSVKLLLGSFLDAQAALRRNGHDGIRTAPGSRVLWQDGYYETFYRWLEYALDDLRCDQKRLHVAVWNVFVERHANPSPTALHNADLGIRVIESSPYRPSYVRVPEQLMYVPGPRKSTHDAKREQNKVIRALSAEGRTHREIADIFGISRRRVGQILAA